MTMKFKLNLLEFKMSLLFIYVFFSWKNYFFNTIKTGTEIYDIFLEGNTVYGKFMKVLVSFSYS